MTSEADEFILNVASWYHIHEYSYLQFYPYHYLLLVVKKKVIFVEV